MRNACVDGIAWILRWFDIGGSPTDSSSSIECLMLWIKTWNGHMLLMYTAMHIFPSFSFCTSFNSSFYHYYGPTATGLHCLSATQCIFVPLSGTCMASLLDSKVTLSCSLYTMRLTLLYSITISGAY